jgi:hypothetical protein
MLTVTNVLYHLIIDIQCDILNVICGIITSISMQKHLNIKEICERLWIEVSKLNKDVKILNKNVKILKKK